MWLHLVAAEQPSGSGDQTAIILGVVGALSLVLVAAVSGVFALLTAKANRTAPAPPPPVPVTSDGNGTGLIRERLAVLERRADDSDARDEVQDRRLERVEDRLDMDDPRWGHDGR